MVRSAISWVSSPWLERPERARRRRSGGGKRSPGLAGEPFATGEPAAVCSAVQTGGARSLLWTKASCPRPGRTDRDDRAGARCPRRRVRVVLQPDGARPALHLLRSVPIGPAVFRRFFTGAYVAGAGRFAPGTPPPKFLKGRFAPLEYRWRGAVLAVGLCGLCGLGWLPA